MTIGNRFELIDGQRLLSQDVLNVYWYEQTAGLSGNAADLIATWEFYLLQDIRDIQSDQLTHIATACRNVDVPTDFSLLLHVPGLAGSYIQASEPAFVASAFLLQRATQASRNGWKRYAGVPDNEVANGVATAGYLTNLNVLAPILSTPITSGFGNTYTPRIVRRVTDPITGIVTYTAFPIAASSFRSISSQNTRKVGAGS